MHARDISIHDIVFCVILSIVQRSISLYTQKGTLDKKLRSNQQDACWRIGA